MVDGRQIASVGTQTGDCSVDQSPSQVRVGSICIVRLKKVRGGPVLAGGNVPPALRDQMGDVRAQVVELDRAVSGPDAVRRCVGRSRHMQRTRIDPYEQRALSDQRRQPLGVTGPDVVPQVACSDGRAKIVR